MSRTMTQVMSQMMSRMVTRAVSRTISRILSTGHFKDDRTNDLAKARHISDWIVNSCRMNCDLAHEKLGTNKGGGVISCTVPRRC